MSMIATRAPLEALGMNSIAGSSRRQATRMSAEAQDSDAPATKKPRKSMTTNAGAIVPTKAQDGDATSSRRSKRKKDYDQESDGFVFTKSKRARSTNESSVRPATREGSEAPNLQHAQDAPVTTLPSPQSLEPAQSDDVAVKVAKKTRKRLPTTPEPDRTAPRDKRPEVRPSSSPHKTSHAQSHANTERKPSPIKPLTVEKKRRKHGDTQHNSRTSRIVLAASDTPIIRRNKAMRQSMANSEGRRSSSGMRGRRASSMIDEGRWNAQPHSAVDSSEFYTMISPDLTEPRRMRLLLGWCGDRALSQKPQAPSNSSKEASERFQALQAARIIQEELSKELNSNGVLSEWFSRDADVPQQPIVLRKRPNPRNVMNTAKVEELERELTRLKAERQEWDKLVSESAIVQSTTGTKPFSDDATSPPHSELLSPSQQEILAQFQQSAILDPEHIQQQLDSITSGVEFAVDQLSQSVHTMSAATDVARRIADQSLSDAAKALDKRDNDLTAQDAGSRVDAVDALKGLAKILNARE